MTQMTDQQDYINDPGSIPRSGVVYTTYYTLGWEYARACALDYNPSWYPWKERHNTIYKMTLDYRQFMEGVEDYNKALTR